MTDIFQFTYKPNAEQESNVVEMYRKYSCIKLAPLEIILRVKFNKPKLVSSNGDDGKDVL